MLAGVALLLTLAAAGVAPTRAQSPGSNAVTAGSQRVSGTSWLFDADIAEPAQSWTSVIVTNLSSCRSPLPIPGTAQAGAIVFTAQLNVVNSQTPHAIYQGDLLPVQGSKASGYVVVVTPQNPEPITHVDAGLFNLEPFALNNTLTVCLLTSSGTPSGAGAPTTLSDQLTVDLEKVVALGYDTDAVVTTPGPNGTTFIGIAGTPIGSADGGNQWVFFFSGATYLGTDTAVPSKHLSLAGSPGPGQINVSYQNFAPTDPLCCPSLPPVTITYTWNGTSVTPNGTPPGH
jgi:hypothetical protein